MALVATAACGSAAYIGPPPNSFFDVPQLKFAVMDTAGKPVWCDPDYWPLANLAREQANAIALYPQIKADTEAYAAIVAHEHLPSGDLTDAQKLTLYRAWKLLRVVNLTATGAGYSFGYEIAAPTAYQQVAGNVTTDGKVTVTSRKPGVRPNCPICLAASTLIATPGAEVRVTDIRVGMIVWTQDAAGHRIAEPVLEVGSVAVPRSHLMVHLVMADGRSLLVSPGHPTADGRTAGELRAGQAFDGSAVTLWELVPYGADRTYDILPAGATGRYWANGILMGSTLA